MSFATQTPKSDWKAPIKTMRLTHLADYAVVLMTAAARREPCARLSATELAQETGVPLPTAQKLMQQACRRTACWSASAAPAAAMRWPGR